MTGGPKCPLEYYGGESLYDGCQCCTSLTWATDPSTVNVPMLHKGWWFYEVEDVDQWPRWLHVILRNFFVTLPSIIYDKLIKNILKYNSFQIDVDIL